MTTVQTNVRVTPGDKPLVRAIAARLRIEPRFRERLKALIDEDPAPAFEARLERVEALVDRLLAETGHARAIDPARQRILNDNPRLNGDA
ncbi:MAG TPA: hypothetical protein VL993_00865 [Stellaceae bacterium]|nr:hypothetical protein [Stellaceae bacterium]